MDDRIHGWLDGDLPFEALTAQEQAAARSLEATVRAAAGRYAEARAPDLTLPVLAALRAEASPASAANGETRARLASYFGRLRARLADALAPSPVLGLRGALALAALALVLGFGLGRILPAAGDDAAPVLFVRFELEEAGAMQVRLAGSFSAWEASHELTPVGPGRWAVTVPLEPGVYDYVFVVDGNRHVVDPFAPRVADGFGGFSSRLAILSP
jgi:hypothetical protein